MRPELPSSTGEVRLGHDLLDKRVVDRNGLPMGRIDGIVVELSERGAPRVTHLEIGGAVLAHRVHPRLAQWSTALRRRWKKKGGTTRIPWEQVRRVGVDIVVDVDANTTPAMAWERWLRDHVLSHIPGGGG